MKFKFLDRGHLLPNAHFPYNRQRSETYTVQGDDSLA